jgi:hypothetical protein
MFRNAIALTVLAASLLAFSAPPLAAGGDTDRPDVLRRKLTAALEQVKSFRILGSVEISEPGNVVNRSGLDGGSPYTGKFEAWSPEDDELVIVSPAALPGFEIYRGKDDDLVRVTYEEGPPSLAELRNDLGALLDMSRLAKWLEQAELPATRDPESGVVRFGGTAPRRLVPAKAGGAAGVLRDQILRVEVFLELTAKGELCRAEFRVVRADLVGALIKGGIGPGGQPIFPQGAGKDEDGPISVYSLSWVPVDPSRRAKEFYETALLLLMEDR